MYDKLYVPKNVSWSPHPKFFSGMIKVTVLSLRFQCVISDFQDDCSTSSEQLVQDLRPFRGLIQMLCRTIHEGILTLCFFGKPFFAISFVISDIRILDKMRKMVKYTPTLMSVIFDILAPRFSIRTGLCKSFFS